LQISRALFAPAEFALFNQGGLGQAKQDVPVFSRIIPRRLIDPVVTVLVIAKNLAALDPPGDHR
jgi:hypothetical protein